MCIGSEYIRWTEPFRRAHTRRVNNQDVLPAIFGFDQYIYNPDRAEENPNLLYDFLERNVYMIDHSHAMWMSLDYTDDLNSCVFMADEHILCKEFMKNRNAVVPLVRDVYNKVIDSYVDSVPAIWFTNDFKPSYVKQLLRTRRDNITEILAKVPACREK